MSYLYLNDDELIENFKNASPWFVDYIWKPF